MSLELKKKEIIKHFISRKKLISKNVLDSLNDCSVVDSLYSDLKKTGDCSFESYEVSGVERPSEFFLQEEAVFSPPKLEGKVSVLWEYEDYFPKRSPTDFTNFF